MENTKRRKIYDEDATLVEEVTTNKKKNNLKIDLDDNIEDQNNSEKKTILVNDVLSAFAGYLPPRANFMDSNPGECKICGKDTSSSMRTICFECMIKYGKELYDEAKNAIERNSMSFEF